MTDTTSIDRETITKAVVAALADTLGRQLPDIREDSRLFDELALDSTGVLGVLISLEDSLGIEIDPDTITEEHFATLGGLVDCVCEAARND